VLVAALDTATLMLSCALVDLAPGVAPRLRCERLEHTPRGVTGAAATGGHGSRLPAALGDLLVAEGLKLPDVEGFAVGLGPGSFTGLRIGLATWKGLAYGNRRPIAGVSSLAAMALAASASAPPGATLVPLLDARKGEVYAGFFRAARGGEGVEPLAPEVALAPEALVLRLATLEAPLVFGGGREAYADAFAALPRLRDEVAFPPALAVAALASARLLGAAFDAQALFALEPHYVRASSAEVRFPKGLGPGADR
jgi:tRNA threonylcarbamoyladenosine biosynthesis protein TsaB